MSGTSDSIPGPDDEMSEYLQTFLDETEEQLDDLVETMLSLEQDSTDKEELNEAFRLIHSIKGSAGLMGLDHITVLTHHLENRFERFRSGAEVLDEATMGLVLRCIDFLRQCVDRLRVGEAMGSPTELLDELHRLEREGPNESVNVESVAESAESRHDSPPVESPVPSKTDGPVEQLAPNESGIRMRVRFRANLPLADLKAQLIVNRLSTFGPIVSTIPAPESLGTDEEIDGIEILVKTDEDQEHLRAVADVEGVESISFDDALNNAAEATDHVDEAKDENESTEESLADPTPAPVPEVDTPDVIDDTERSSENVTASDLSETESPATIEPENETEPQANTTDESQTSASSNDQPPTTPTTEKAPTKVQETMRVDIDRLDNLMNLAGELVVNRARFEQISEQISPSRGKTTKLNRIREFCDALERSIRCVNDDSTVEVDRDTLLNQLRSGLELMEEHVETWENDRRQIEQFGEAIDQLARVSQSMQKGVLDTRMVPVAPLFNRFKRVVRDLSKDRGKRVNLELRGEKTELDKRMIDELGDPLVHLVRNSLDHGLEPPEDRIAAGKSEIGTISLAATHSGNNVIIHVRDDGRGIDTDRIRAKLIQNQILTEVSANDLSDEQALDYIWHPGFSTAKEITDISGRGVGMDVVLNRIRRLNGSVDVESVMGEGTHFSIRLPLTLAIINCLLVRMRGIVFSIPIDDVREIVSIEDKDVISVHGKKTFEIRDEFIPLLSINDIFQWNETAGAHDDSNEVVILRKGDKSMGLRVGELFGSQDMVVKSLSDNFVDIRGLSGASILGDGTVCLMLDVTTTFQMATQASSNRDSGG